MEAQGGSSVATTTPTFLSDLTTGVKIEAAILGVHTLELLVAIITLIVIWRAYFIAREQLRPFRDDLARLTSQEQRAGHINRIRASQKSPRDLAGYDPRFTSTDWNEILPKAPERISKIRMNIFRNYHSFATSLGSDWQNLAAGLKPSAQGFANYRNSVLIVDVEFIPELLEKRLIAPLSSENGLDFENMMNERFNIYSVKYDQHAYDLMRILSTSHDQQVVGALPLWINCHGRMIPDIAARSPDLRIAGIRS